MLKYFSLFVIFILFSGFLTKCSSQDITQGKRQKRHAYFWTNYTYIYAGNSFYKYHTEEKDWHDAKEVCDLEEASLFYPEHKDEVDAVILFWKQSRSKTKINKPEWTLIYVGISDIKTEGVYETIDGKTDVYINWKEGQPDNWMDNEHCLEVNLKGFFNDIPCTTLREFICKKSPPLLNRNCGTATDPSLKRNCSTATDPALEPNNSTATDPSLEWNCSITSSNIQPFDLFPFMSLKSFVFWPNSTVPLCIDPDGFTQTRHVSFWKDYQYIYAGKSFYKYHMEQKNWHDAKEVCALEEASLFYPEHKDEADAVILFWKQSRGITKIIEPKWTFIYVGISDIITEGVYKTIDGIEVYINWREGQPDNWKDNEDCVELNLEGFYNDIACTALHEFICKKSPPTLERNCSITSGNIQANFPFVTLKTSVLWPNASVPFCNDLDDLVVSLKTFVFWPNATVPFYIDPDHFDNEQATLIMNSLAMFGFKTCIQFALVTSAPSEGQHVMTFINPEGVRRCRIETMGHSNYNPHLILLGYECLKTRELDMIIMRALGLPFEHNRASRDVYIDVLIENIEPSYIQLFTKDSILPRPLRDIPYDQNSIMHFGERDYSKNGHETIKFKYPRFRQHKNGLTPADIKKIALVYGPECRIRDRAENIPVEPEAA